jgi:cell division protein FtsI (penicillin-binding protein 3)
MDDATAAAPASDPPARPAPVMPWHRRLVQALLYGRNVDRDRKARARLGLGVIGFAAIYCVIAGKLVIFAIAPDSHAARRAGSGDAVATARPEIRDRNDQVLAIDVKRPSLFAEPRRIYDPDVGIELLTAVIPDLDTNELRQRLGSKRGFAWLKREITPQQQEDVRRLGIPGVGFLTENKRVYRDGPEVSTTRASPASRAGSTGRGSQTCTGPVLRPTASRSRSCSRSTCASSTRCVTSCSRRKTSTRPRRRPASSTRCAPARSWRWRPSPTSIRTIRARCSTRIAPIA